MPNEKIPSLSAKEKLILEILQYRPAGLYGLDIRRESNGKIGQGSLYVTLYNMEEKGLIESRPEDGEPAITETPRRIYRINDLGRLALFV